MRLSRSSCHVPVPAPVTTGQGTPAASMRLLRVGGERARVRDRLEALVGPAQVLRRAVIGVQPAKAQARGTRDRLRERHRRRARRDAAAMRADVDLHVDVQRAPGQRGGGREVRDHARVVHEDADGRRLRERREARDLRRRHDLVGDEHVGDAGRDERRGFVHLLATDADGAPRDLCLRDVDALVRLRVRAQREARAVHRVGHEVEVVLERVEVDDQGRCVDSGERIADAGGDALHQQAQQPFHTRSPSRRPGMNVNAPAITRPPA